MTSPKQEKIPLKTPIKYFFQAFILVMVVDLIQARSAIFHAPPDSPEHKIQFSSAIIRLICLAIYLLSLLPSADDSESHYEELLTNEMPSERQPLNGSASRRIYRHSYGGFHEPVDPNYLVRLSGTMGSSWRNGYSDLLLSHAPGVQIPLPPTLFGIIIFMFVQGYFLFSTKNHF
jgi:hypothetical protein